MNSFNAYSPQLEYTFSFCSGGGGDEGCGLGSAVCAVDRLTGKATSLGALTGDNELGANLKQPDRFFYRRTKDGRAYLLFKQGAKCLSDKPGTSDVS